MAEIIDNQPIIFNEAEDCLLEDSELNVLAQYGDVTQFQMKLEPCGSDFEIIQNGNFADASEWTTFGGWSIANGEATHVQGSSGQLYQSAPSSDGTLVRLTFDFVNGDQTQELNVGWSGVNNYISQSGSYEFWIEADNATNVVFTAFAAQNCIISNIQMISINTNFSVAVIDLDNTPVLQLPTTAFDFSDGYFTASVDWQALSIADGCYRLVVIDPCPCSQRGVTALDFTASTFEWSSNSAWVISGGSAVYNDSAQELTSLLNVVCSGSEYSVTFTISGMSGNEEFSVGLGSTFGTTITSNGTFTQTITANGSRVALRGNSTSGTQTFTVTDMEIEEITPSSVLLSNVIKVSETLDCGTLEMAICNDSDALGFGFANTGFRPTMRIPASLNRSSYPMERLSYDNSRGRKYTYYGRLRKSKELGFDAKEFMHDFASLFGLADHFYIDGSEYFVEDDEYPSISWSEFDDVGGVTINVSEKLQLVENRRISSSSVGCSTESLELLDNSGQEITDEIDSVITTN